VSQSIVENEKEFINALENDQIATENDIFDLEFVPVGNGKAMCYTFAWEHSSWMKFDWDTEELRTGGVALANYNEQEMLKDVNVGFFGYGVWVDHTGYSRTPYTYNYYRDPFEIRHAVEESYLSEFSYGDVDNPLYRVATLLEKFAVNDDLYMYIPKAYQ